MHASLETRVHDRQILIRQRDVQHEVWFVRLNQRDQLRHVVRVHLRRRDKRFRRDELRDLELDRITLTEGSRGDHELREDCVILRHFLGDHATNATRTNHQDFSHVEYLRKKQSVTLEARARQGAEYRVCSATSSCLLDPAISGFVSRFRSVIAVAWRARHASPLQ